MFKFNGELYHQKIGTAIRAVPSPEICDILMFEIIEKITNSFQHKHKIFYSGRYRDDGFIIYHGNKEEIENFFDLANNFHPYVKFTYDISNTNVDFLDIHLYKGQRFAEEQVLDMKTYFKPTNSFMYLQRNSCHSKHVFSGFIKGETIRYIRNTNNTDELKSIVSKFRSRLINRGYSLSEIDQSMHEIINENRTDLFKQKRKK